MRFACLAVLLLAGASAASAQTRPVSLVVKSAVQPQFGVEARLVDRVSLRALTAFVTDFGNTSAILNLAGFYRLSDPGRFSTRLGVSATIVDFEDVALFGVVVGVDSALSDRFAVFGEVGLDVDESVDLLYSSTNTGVGVRVGL